MAHVLDDKYLGKLWTNASLAEFFSERERFQRWLDIEAALALAEGDLGVIPADAAGAIAQNARIDLLDHDLIDRGYAETGHSLVPVLKALEHQCPQGAGEYIHFGATTQDILDTELSLAIRHVWHSIMTECGRLESSLISLAKQYRSTPMAGRTQCQQALPITAGLKFAEFAVELRRDMERLKDFSKRGFMLMMHGAVGTLAGYGPHAYEIRSLVAERLGLEVPPICWSSSRDSVAEFQTILGLLAGTLMRMGNTVCTLGHTEIGEWLEPLEKGKVGSSTMPHKRNPQRSSMTVALGRIVQSNVQLALEGQCMEHERDSRTWRLDMHSIPESSIMIAKMLDNMNIVFNGLIVDESAMRRNLDLLGGMLLSEAVMFELGKSIGKQTAHHVVQRAVAACEGNAGKFREKIMAQPEVQGFLTMDRLIMITKGESYLGFAESEIDGALNYCERCAETDLHFQILSRR